MAELVPKRVGACWTTEGKWCGCVTRNCKAGERGKLVLWVTGAGQFISGHLIPP